MRRTMLAWMLAMLLLGACNEPPPGLVASPSAERTGTPLVTDCSNAITTDETPYLGGIDNLAWQADLIVEGTVIETLPATWSDRGNVDDITTDYILRIDQHIAGDAGDTIRVRRSGGTVGCGSLENAVTPQLRDGDRVLLFLRRDDSPGLPAAYRILGEGQGYWRLEAGPEGELAIKQFRSDTGAFGNSTYRDLPQEIIEKVRQARLRGTPTPGPSDDLAIQIIEDYGPPIDAGDLLPYSGLVVIGTVVEVLPPQWSTPDGQRPADFVGSVPDSYTIFSPSVVELDGPPLLNRYGPLVDRQRITVAVEGGRIGSNAVNIGSNIVNSSPRFVVGERVLVMLSPFRALGGGFGRFMTPRGLAWNLGSKYTIYGDEIYPPDPRVKTEPLERFVQRLKAAIQAGQPGTP